MDLKFLFVRKYDENRTITTHSHDIHEFVYYFDGTGSSWLGHEQHRFEKDSYAIIAPNVAHSESHIGKGHIMAVGFSINESSDLLHSTIYRGFDPNIYALIQKIKTEFVLKKDFYEDMIKSLLKELILHIRRKQLIASKPLLNKRNDLSYAISYMNEYFMTDIDLDELAHSSGYCKDHFRILFKEATGNTPKAFILSKKLAYAKKLLADGEAPLNEIAINLGFEYYSCFSAFFKKRTGLSPLKYRKKNHQYLVD